MLSFSAPLALLLSPLPLLLYFIHARFRRTPGIPLPLDVWAGPRLPSPPSPTVFSYRLSSLLYGIAWILMVCAIAGPHAVSREVAALGRDVDVIFAVDVSPSMAAMDMQPNRLETAVSFIEDYIAQDSGTAVGIVAFGGEAALICPPTSDHGAVIDRLALLKPGMLGEGTALGLGMASALGHVLRSDGRKKAMVLISDGEDNVGKVHPMDVAFQIYRSGVFVTIIGLGTRGTASIEYTDPATGERLVGAYQSGFDESYLKELASAAGGNYRYADASGDLAKILSSLGGHYAAPGHRDVSAMRVPKAHVFFMFSLLCAAAAWATGNILLGGVA